MELSPPRVRGRPHAPWRSRSGRGLGQPPKDERRTRFLDAIASPGSSFRYTYDFGDNWDHRIVVEKVHPAATVNAPACVDGRRACPPEDCGGTWGIGSSSRSSPTQPTSANDERLEIGRPFDPGAFDAAEFEDNLRNGQFAAFDDEP